MNGYTNSVTYQLTDWEDPDRSITLGSGEKTDYHRYLQKEQLRISGHPDRMADIRFNSQGYVALFVNPWKRSEMSSWEITAQDHKEIGELS